MDNLNEEELKDRIQKLKTIHDIKICDEPLSENKITEELKPYEEIYDKYFNILINVLEKPYEYNPENVIEAMAKISMIK